MLKQTFVSELEKFTNIYSQFTIFCKRNDQNFKSFTIDNEKKIFQLKNDYNGEKDLLLSLKKLNGSPAKLFSNKISITFLVKSKNRQREEMFTSAVDSLIVLGIQDLKQIAV